MDLRVSAKLGERLLKEKLITAEQLMQAVEHQKSSGGRLGESLVKLGFLTDEEVTAVLSRQYGVPSINLEHFEVDPNATKLIPMETAIKYQVLPLKRVGSSLTLAMVDPTNVFAIDDIKFMTGFNIEPVIASEAALMEAIKKYYGSVEDQERKKELEEIANFIDEGQTKSLELQSDEEGAPNIEQLEKAAEEAPAIKLVNHILMDAVKRGASDIHMEAYEKEYHIRYRIDGVLQTIMNLPFRLRDDTISRVKIMSKLDIANKHSPQNGRMNLRLLHQDETQDMDFHVSVFPTPRGEKVVIRRRSKKKGDESHRFVNTWFEGDIPVFPLKVGQWSTFKLNIGSRRVSPGGTITPFEEPDFGHEETQSLHILTSLFSEDFEISEHHFDLVLPRTGDTDTIQTRVAPRHAGECVLEIIVSLARELEILQTLEVRVEAVEASVPAKVRG